ncbi:MAG TPA: ROK family protein, partial [Polyangiaceae bacterium]|nr:ROK family protein [Polyangiaceae bacterium]
LCTRLPPMTTGRIGIVLGGSKIEALFLDADGSEVARQRVATPPAYEPTIDLIAALVTRLEAQHGPATVGVGMPGTLVPTTGLVKNANRAWLNGRAFRHDLERTLGRLVRCANDGDCCAASEALDGAGAGARVVFAAVIGTGCGAGLAIDGRPWHGASGVCGEWGHNALPWPEPDEFPGPPCTCGKRGCIEAWIAGPALVDDHRRRTGSELTGPEIARHAQSGEPAAAETLTRWESRLARSLATVVNLLDPDVVVLGGGLSNLEGIYATLPARVASHVFGGECATAFRRARHGDASGVRGAALLW